MKIKLSIIAAAVGLMMAGCSGGGGAGTGAQKAMAGGSDNGVVGTPKVSEKRVLVPTPTTDTEKADEIGDNAPM